MEQEEKLLELLQEYNELGIGDQLDNLMFYIYAIVAHSTMIEGSTLTEKEVEKLLKYGITTGDKTMEEHDMNRDLLRAYEQSLINANSHANIDVKMLIHLSSLVMKNTGTVHQGMLGDVDISKGELRKFNVTAGIGGPSYMDFHKVEDRLKKFCVWLNEERNNLEKGDVIGAYNLSFDAHYYLVTIHPWGDGNGRMSRLLMNQLQVEFGVVPTMVRKESKANYIDALIKTRDKEDVSIFRNFMMKEQCKNLEAAIGKYKESIKSDITLKPSVRRTARKGPRM